jgi:hypothetical protein
MILSSTAEFTPWVIQPKKENQFTELTDLTKTISSKEFDDELELNGPEGVTAEERDGEQFDGTELHDDEISASPQSDTEIKEMEESIAPELLPKYTTVEFQEYGEAEYLRGYNSCKENEQLEFSGRLEQLDNLLATIANEHVDLNEFYDPIRELIVSAIKAILQVDLAESEDSISEIVATILKEITLESDGSVRLFLNPSDASILKDFDPDTENSVKILSDARLNRGSARAVMGDSIIESMKENRVQQIVDQIMGDTQKKSAARNSQNKVASKRRSVKKKA